MLKEVKRSLNKKFEKILSEAEPRRREYLKPSLEEVAEIIKGQIYSVSEKEDSKSEVSKEETNQLSEQIKEDTWQDLRSSLSKWFKERLKKKVDKEAKTINDVLQKKFVEETKELDDDSKAKNEFASWLDGWLTGLKQWDLQLRGVYQAGDPIEDYTFERFMEETKKSGVKFEGIKERLKELKESEQTSEVEKYMITKLLERLNR